MRPDNRKERPYRRGLVALVVALSLVGVAVADPMKWREYPGVEYYDFELPTDFRQPAEWIFARLMYPSIGWGGGMWQSGGTSWTIDYPRGDRHIAGLERRASGEAARVPATRRFLDGRRLPRHRAVDGLRREHAARVPRAADRRLAR